MLTLALVLLLERGLFSRKHRVLAPNHRILELRHTRAESQTDVLASKRNWYDLLPLTLLSVYETHPLGLT